MTSPAKQIVLDELLAADVNVGEVSVTRGRGTGHQWITVRSEVEISMVLKNQIIKTLEADKLIGHYYDDGPGDGRYPTISWNSFSGKF